MLIRVISRRRNTLFSHQRHKPNKKIIPKLYCRTTVVQILDLFFQVFEDSTCRRYFNFVLSWIFFPNPFLYTILGLVCNKVCVTFELRWKIDYSIRYRYTIYIYWYKKVSQFFAPRKKNIWEQKYGNTFWVYTIKIWI